MRKMIPAFCLASLAIAQAAFAQAPIPGNSNQSKTESESSAPKSVSTPFDQPPPLPFGAFGQPPTLLPSFPSVGESAKPSEPLPLPPWPRDLGPLKFRAEREPETFQLALYKTLVEAMTKAKLAAPEGRIKHFNWLKNLQPSSIEGWQGIVTDIEPIPGGHLVTVRVNIRVQMSYNADSVSERYTVIDGKVRFLDGNFSPHPGARILFGF